jgi:tripeptide aminopeptidase
LQRVTHQALGSRRFRIHMTGPGGHSWADFGRPNPVQAIASAIHNFAAGSGRRPGTAFNFGVVRGGISVNAIPREAVMEVDLRSISAASLDDLENYLKRTLNEATRTSGVECRIELMGERPSGSTSASLPIVQAAMAVTRRFGVEPLPDVGSTDANIPIALGIPAVALGGGGSCGNVHTPEEWFDPARRDLGVQRLLALLAVLAGLE